MVSSQGDGEVVFDGEEPRPEVVSEAPHGWFTRAWTWVGAVDVTGLGRAERARASIVPLLIMLPVVMAFAAGSVFASTVFRAPLPVALVSGLIWAGLIFVLERAVVVSDIAPRHRGWALFVRLVVAGAMGYVIAEPLVALMFKSDIDAKVEVVREEKRRSALEDIATNPRYGDEAIAAARTRLDRARAALTFSGSDPADVVADPEVARLRGELAAAEQARAVQAAAVQTEADGSGGSLRAGIGPRYEEKLKELNRLEAEIGAKREALAAAENAASVRSTEERSAESAASRTDLPAIERDLAEREAERGRADSVAQETATEASSLGVRAEAFEKLRADNASINRSYLAFTIMLILLDISAVIVKFLMRPSLASELAEINRRARVERCRLVNDHRQQELETMFAEDSARNTAVRAAMQVDFDERLRTLIEDGRNSEQPLDDRASEWIDQADTEARRARAARSWWRDA